ncbi:membrane-bound lytic murein transglycosylase B [Streptomyces achromogenes]|uniref:Membrane-bound lytic murein transglycosylase B n=1 Tax=Streptomyces achromogenes TaxID=67255 RepID=A0ABU0PXH7_STRAH|nr:lytic transglycosylase domain-containing protein [Streptomyces achromogenes]MDQ0683104.1 membrane-bound lytic murein transglycosylase B [Streptomyces achromogenes]MDQ0830304.1 membrane-bound lytic murein transglycosylase B [Streptomyces achromogenes]
MSAHFGTRLRKGAVNTTVAALAVAALAASQAPDVTADTQGRRTAADTPATEAGADAGTDDSATGNSPYYTDLPPLHSPNPAPTQSSATTPAGGGAGEAGIPATVLDAYKKAEAQLAQAKPGCNLPWQLLAAIGKVESGQARGGDVTADGTTVSPILGPVLNGSGFANIRDTDNGAYDGDRTFDRAVGPMQFIPSTWAWAGRDGNADGKKDPNNIYDAALAAGHYLCRYGWDMATTSGMRTAILSYNNSTDYLNTVLSWLEYYRKGSHEIPDGTGTVPTDRSDDYTPSPPSVPTTPGTPSVPNAPGRPTKPSTPGKPTKPSTPTKPTPTPTPAPTPTETVHHLEAAGPAKITAMAGDVYTDRVSARAETAAGKAVAKVRIRFTIVGDTDAEFTGGENVATIVTDSKGIALAPALQAGEKSGAFTVRATVLGRTLSALDYAATVTPRAADVLTRTGDTALTCTVGGEFADAVEVKATYKGTAAGKVAATATLVKAADDPTVNDKGPYFKGAADSPVRTLDLQTDADGLLRLPQLYAGDTAGAYLLRITTTGGAVLTVELTVTAAETSTPTAAPVESEPEATPSAS